MKTRSHAVQKLSQGILCTAMDGFAVVEFAIVLPVIVFVGYLSMWLLGLGVLELQLHNDAQTAVRFLARGDTVPESVTLAAHPSRSIKVQLENEMVGVDLSETRKVPLILREVTLHAQATARSELVNP